MPSQDVDGRRPAQDGQEDGADVDTRHLLPIDVCRHGRVRADDDKKFR